MREPGHGLRLAKRDGDKGRENARKQNLGSKRAHWSGGKVKFSHDTTPKRCECGSKAVSAGDGACVWCGKALVS